MMGLYIDITYLVGGIHTPLKNHGVSSSWDDEIPNIWKNKKCSKPTNHICHSYWISWILNRYLRIISHSYWSYVRQLSYRLGAPHCSDINCIIISWTKENVKWLCWKTIWIDSGLPCSWADAFEGYCKIHCSSLKSLFVN